jgi:AmmeMemoRadiSam system protein B
MEPLPRIRAGIEALPATYQGKDIVVLHDRLGITPDVILSREAVPILACLDGTHTLQDIQIMLMRRRGFNLVSLEELRKLLDALDGQHLLDNERFRRHQQEVADRFRDETVRTASHAGSAYAADPEELNRQLAGYFDGLADNDERPPAPPGELRGLILPHIDFHRGGSCYAWGYSALKEADDFDLFVILGTCHLPMELPFALTTKTFRTPLGEVPADGRLAAAIAEKSGLDFFRDELVHRAEHAIEFQIVFLQHLLRDKRPLHILPILCRGFHEMICERVLPSAQPAYLQAMKALAEVLAESHQKLCLIASADLAHVGPQFGDPRQIERADLPRIARQDRDLLEPVLHGDAQGFYRQIMAENDSRRICGLPPIYTLLQVLQPERVDLLNYGQAYDPNATVTFAGLAVY